MKLKLSTGSLSAVDNGASSPANNASGATQSSGGQGFKIRINASNPPTPAIEHSSSGLPYAQAGVQKPKRAAEILAEESARGKKGKGSHSKKRAANDDSISPAAKRAASGAAHVRKFSLKGPLAPLTAEHESAKITLKRKSTVPKLKGINVKAPLAPRLPGQGYDSEDSEAEKDPAIQQAFILRMEPGEDAEYLREAIANGKIGLAENEGGAEASLRFLEKDCRRALVTVRGRMYAAALVDLPCIIETMKSWDKKGWWKVADVCQMLLVLGRCGSEEEAKNFPLPREVDKETLQYPHGLTPPMKWVRKRRFRKRLSYKAIANVEEEVERLLAEDDKCEREGGWVTWDTVDHAESQDAEQSPMEDAIDTVEDVQQDGVEYEYEDEDEIDDVDLEGGLQAAFDQEEEAAELPATKTESPTPAMVEEALVTSTPQTPLSQQAQHEQPTPASSDDEEDVSDEDDDDDDASSMPDEDAAALAAERNQQLEEVADLKREVDAQRRKADNMKNQLLKERALAQLRTLQEDLIVKRRAFGLDEEDEGEDGPEAA